MQVRTLHLTDLLKLGRMHQADIGLNLPYNLVTPDLPLPAAFTQHLPVNSLNTSVFIYETDGKPEAFVQARGRHRREEWEVLSLGVIGDVQPESVELTSSAGPVETELRPTGGKLDTAGAVVTAPALDISQAPPAAAGPAEDDEPDDFPLTLIKSWPEEIELAWLKLLEHLVIEAGEKGVVRLYARLPVDAPQLDLFTQIGFHAYTRETLFHLNYREAIERSAPANLKLKEQRSRDSWPVQQLYAAVTPTYVQNSEQMTSRSWELSKGYLPYLPRPVKETGWVWYEEGQVAAYVRVLSRRNRHLLRMMTLDNRRELLPYLIQFALSTLKSGDNSQVYCVVREYQMEQEAVLEEAGFQRIFGKQAVLVKHTVQFVRSTERALARGREGKLELARTSLRPDVLARLFKIIRKHFSSLVTL